MKELFRMSCRFALKSKSELGPSQVQCSIRSGPFISSSTDPSGGEIPKEA